MGYALRPGFSYCRIGAQAVFLDLPNDRYFCLPARSHRVFLKITERKALDASDRASIASLIDMGLLVECKGTVVPEPCAAVALPTRSLLDDLDRGVGMGAILSAARLLAFTRWQLRHKRLPALLDAISHRAIGCKPQFAPDSRVRQTVRAFEAARLLLNAEDQCLWRSIALALALVRQGCRPQLIFGVTIAPFTAHCWVQQGETVLNDRPEIIRPFTPILAI